MKEEVLAKIERNKTELLKFASELIKFRTPNPPGKNTLPAQSWLAGELKKLGMAAEMLDVYPGEPDVIGKLKGKSGKKTLAINGHMDVAEVKEYEGWNFDPFSAKYDNDFLYGRGSNDMKGGLAAAYFAIKTLIEEGFELKHHLEFQSVIGEEAGEPGTKRILERGQRYDFALIPEPNSLQVQGQGGAITFWITIKSPQVFHDAARHKMIHAGGGIEGANTVEKMCKIIQSMQELERHWAVVKKYPGITPGATTINPAVIEGGRNPIFIPDECKVWYTVHLLPNEKDEDVMGVIKNHVKSVAQSDVWLRKNPPELTWGGESLVRENNEVFPPADIDENNPYVDLLLQSHEEVLGRRPKVSIWPSVSDAGWFSKFGVPSAICGPGALEGAHVVNEKVSVKELVDTAKLYADFIMKFCEIA